MAEPKPDTLNFEKRADGVQIVLLKPPLCRRSRKSLGRAIFAAVIVTMFASSVPAVSMSLYGKKGAPFLLLPIMGLAMAAAIISDEINWYRETAVLDLGNGILTIVRSSSDLPKQWPRDEIRTVRAWSLGRLWELQVELKSGQITRLLTGRSRMELQWIASLLRDALGRKAPPTPPAAAPVTFIDGGECQICGANMTDRVVFCAKCRTPHHEECWTYNGACSTYGCREIRFTRTS